MLLLRGSQRQQQQPKRTTRATSTRVIVAPRKEEVPRDRRAEAHMESVSIGTDMEPDCVSVVKDSKGHVTTMLVSGGPEFQAWMAGLMQERKGKFGGHQEVHGSSGEADKSAAGVCPQLPLPGLQGPSYPLTDVEGFTFFDADIGVQTDPLSTADVGIGVQKDLLNPADLADYQRRLAQMRAADAANELRLRKLGHQHKLDLKATSSKAAQTAAAAARKRAAAAHEVDIQQLHRQHKEELQAAASQAAQAATAEAKAAHEAHLQQLRQQHQQEIRAARSEAAQAATAAAKGAAAEAIAGTSRLLELHMGVTSRVQGQLVVAEAAADATRMHAGKLAQEVNELTTARSADAHRHAESQQQLAALQQQLQQAVANAAAAEEQLTALKTQHKEASARLAPALRGAQAAAAAAGQDVQRLQQEVSEARTARDAAETELSKTAQRLSVLHRENLRSLQAATAAESAAEGLREQVASKSARVETLEAELSAERSSKQAVQQEADGLRAQLTALQAQKASWEAERRANTRARKVSNAATSMDDDVPEAAKQQQGNAAPAAALQAAQPSGKAPTSSSGNSSWFSLNLSGVSVLLLVLLVLSGLSTAGHSPTTAATGLHTLGVCPARDNSTARGYSAGNSRSADPVFGALGFCPTGWNATAASITAAAAAQAHASAVFTPLLPQCLGVSSLEWTCGPAADPPLTYLLQLLLQAAGKSSAVQLHTNSSDSANSSSLLLTPAQPSSMLDLTCGLPDTASFMYLVKQLQQTGTRSNSVQPSGNSSTLHLLGNSSSSEEQAQLEVSAVPAPVAPDTMPLRQPLTLDQKAGAMLVAWVVGAHVHAALIFAAVVVLPAVPAALAGPAAALTMGLQWRYMRTVATRLVECRDTCNMDAGLFSFW